MTENESKEPVLEEEKTSASRYTLDEMVRSLKEGERNRDDQGELVTLEDGSVMRRVKRRKRRSNQSKKKKKEDRDKKIIVYQILGFVSFLVLAAAYLGFLFFRSNSSSYREKLEKNTADWLGAEVSINGLSIAPTSATINALDFSWGENSFVEELKLSAVSADTRMKDFLFGNFQGVDLGGKVGTLDLQMPQSDAPVVKPFEPNNYPYSFDFYYCESLAVNFGENAALRLENLNASYRYLIGSGHQSVINGGLLKLDGWSPFTIENATITFKKDAVNIVGLRLQDAERKSGELVVSGVVPLVKGADYHLDVTTGDFSVSSLFGDNLGRLFEGRLRTEQGVISFKQGETKPQSVVIPFTGDSMSIKKLPFLAVLDELFPEEGFLDPVFDKNGSAIFQWSQEGVGLKNIKLRQSSKMLLSGHILANHEGMLVGNLVIKLNKGILARQAIFKNNPGLEIDAGDTGYAVVRLKLSGTIEEPVDDFRQVIGMDHSLNLAPSEKANGDFENLFRELTE